MAETTNDARRKRPSARRAGVAQQQDNGKDARDTTATDTQPRPAAASQKSSARVAARRPVRATARGNTVGAHIDSASATAPVDAAAPAPTESTPGEHTQVPQREDTSQVSAQTQAQLQGMESDLAALLGDVQHVDDDASARQRAAQAIASIANRLAENETAAPARRPWQYLSTDYYLKRIAQRGMRDRSEQVDDFGLDPIYEARTWPLLELLCTKYFRTQLEGVDNIPMQGKVLLVCNHGGALPWDGLMLRTAVRLEHPAARELRWLIEDAAFHAPFLGSVLSRIGAVRACQENAERLLSQNELVAVFPEGQKGIEKAWGQRYRLQRFGRGGYIKLALRTGTPILPVAIVGAEEAHPALYQPKLLAKLLGLHLPVTPTFPWLGPLGIAPLPSRWRIEIGPAVSDLAGYGPEAANDEVLIGELNERVRSRLQLLVLEAERRRGRSYV